MKKPTLLVLFVVLSIFSQAQQLPMLSWAKSMGSAANNDMGTAIAIDVAGNVYTTGYFGGVVDFDPGAGTYTLSSAGGFDIFVSKLDASGNFVWAKAMGGPQNDFGWGIKVDGAGNVYTTGSFLVTSDFDPSVSTYTLTSFGAEDVFVSKLDVNGNFVWAKQLGGTSSDGSSGIALDASANVHVTGNFSGTGDFDPSVSTFTLASAGVEDIFVSKLTNAGVFVWAKQMGGSASDYGNAVSVDASGNVYSAGSFQNTADFDPNGPVINLTSFGSDDIFISKLDISGNYVWAKTMGGLKSDLAFAMTLDATGNVYTTGNYDSIADFDPSGTTFTLSVDSTVDIFVSKLNSSGNFVWAKSMGSKQAESGQSISVDNSGNVFTTGYFWDTADFDPSPSTFTYTSNGAADIFISKLDVNGNFLWAEQIGRTGYDYGLAITTDPTGNNIYTTGFYQDTVDFDPLLTTYTLAANGATDIFVHKMIPSTVGTVELGVGSSEFLVYPNPTNGTVNLNASNTDSYRDASVSLYNTLGELLLTTVTKGTKCTIDLTNYPNGMYFIKIGQLTQKIIKE